MDLIGWACVIGIALFVFAIVLYIALFQPNNLTPTDTPVGTPPTPVSMLYRCQSSSDCNGGLVCDGNLGVCVQPNGGVCESATDCLSTSYCSGICLDRTIPSNYASPSPTPGQPCPCSEGYSCVARSDGETRCYKSSGSQCEVNSDCVSGLCVYTPELNIALCADTKNVGSSCTENSECSSGNCSCESTGCACQNKGVQSGQLGAWCGDTNVSTVGCAPGLACSTAGVCTDNVNNLEEGCNGGSGCSGLYTCYAIPPYGTIPGCTLFGSTSDLRVCEGGTDFCQCMFNYDVDGGHVYPQPNVLTDNTKVCSSSFVKSGERCIGLSGNFCASSTDCLGGSCLSTASGRNIPALLQGDVSVANLFVSTTTESGTSTLQRTYPLTGLSGMENITYDPLFSGDATDPVTRILGYTSNYRSSKTPGINYPAESETLYTLTAGGVMSLYDAATNTSKPMTFVLNDSRYTLDKIVSADATIVPYADGTEIPLVVLVLAVTAIVGNTKSLVLATFNFLGGIYYLVVYGTWSVASPDFTNTATVVRLTLTASLGVSDSLVLVKNGASSAMLYLNGGLITNPLPSTAVWSTVTLNHGLVLNELGIPSDSYRLLMYINTVTAGIESYLAFSDAIDGFPSGTAYSTLRYPTTQFTAPADCSDPYRYNTLGFQSCNVDPLVLGYSNIILSASLRDGIVVLPNTIYYVNNGVETVIPGYPNSSCQFLMTSSQFYIYSNQTCS